LQLSFKREAMGMSDSKRWTVEDRDGNPIYLTQERWEHIIGPLNHPEMADYEEHLRTAIRRGRRRQEPLNPRKYRYSYQFDDLPDDSNHIVAIVLFGFDVDQSGKTHSQQLYRNIVLQEHSIKG
jgi:hypothetical protein